MAAKFSRCCLAMKYNMMNWELKRRWRNWTMIRFWRVASRPPWAASFSQFPFSHSLTYTHIFTHTHTYWLTHVYGNTASRFTSKSINKKALPGIAVISLRGLAQVISGYSGWSFARAASMKYCGDNTENAESAILHHFIIRKYKSSRYWKRLVFTIRF